MYNKRNYLSYSYSKCFQSMIYTHKTNCSEIPVNTFFKKNCKKVQFNYLDNTVMFFFALYQYFLNTFMNRVQCVDRTVYICG